MSLIWPQSKRQAASTLSIDFRRDCLDCLNTLPKVRVSGDSKTKGWYSNHCAFRLLRPLLPTTTTTNTAHTAAAIAAVTDTAARQWGAADAEMKVPAVQSTELKDSPF